MKEEAKEIEVMMPRSDVIFFHRVIDDAFAEIEAAVSDGDVDEAVLIELDEARTALEQYLGTK